MFDSVASRKVFIALDWGIIAITLMVSYKKKEIIFIKKR